MEKLNQNLKNNKKNIIFFILIIVLLSIVVVPKQFQNDTFFNISIGKYILENKIDMQEHFSWISGLTYTYSHWAFDIIIYLIYSKFNFQGIYCFVIIFTSVINITLFLLLNKTTKKPIVSLTVTIITMFLNAHYYAARSQIVSFLCFIIEIYCIEQFIKTNKIKYGVVIFILGIVIANFHAATWPLIFVLFMPYIAAGILNILSSKNFYPFLKKHSEKKLNKTPKSSKKYSKFAEDIRIYDEIIKENASANKEPYKIIIQDSYNLKNLIILMLIIIITGFITPIKDVPFTYIIKSMFGYSNFENVRSIAYISEMQPIIPATSISYMLFIPILIGLLTFCPTKVKIEHLFLLLGLLIMTLSSNRYLALLIFLGSYVVADLTNQCFNIYTNNVINPFDFINTLEIILSFPIVMILITISVSIYTITSVHKQRDISFIDNSIIPVEATNYILNNINYHNMKIYNDYDFGSYLMLHNIPVFIDSRLDVYCSEFNDTDVFRDYIGIVSDKEYYEDIFTKYNFTHVLLKNDELILKYLEKDPNYSILYEDENFTLFERNVK